MNRLAVAGLALALAAGPATAGGFAPVVVPDPVVVVEPEPARSTWGILVPLLLLGALVYVATRDDDEEEAPPPVLSDARIKTDITRVGTSPSGLPIYTFHYIGVPTLYEGVLAQDLVALRPDAVVPGPLGLLTVDVSRIDVAFRALD